jgi:hypothetical protein
MRARRSAPHPHRQLARAHTPRLHTLRPRTRCATRARAQRAIARAPTLTRSQLVDLLAPYIRENEIRVEHKWKTCVDRVQATEERLISARGVAKSMRATFRIFVRCAAARPRDVKGKILKDEKPIFEQFRASNPCFQGEALNEKTCSEWRAVLACVREAEDYEISNHDKSSSVRDLEQAASPFSKKIAERVTKPLCDAVTAQVGAQVTTQVEELQAQITQLQATNTAMQLRFQASMMQQSVHPMQQALYGLLMATASSQQQHRQQPAAACSMLPELASQILQGAGGSLPAWWGAPPAFAPPCTPFAPSAEAGPSGSAAEGDNDIFA